MVLVVITIFVVVAIFGPCVSLKGSCNYGIHEHFTFAADYCMTHYNSGYDRYHSRSFIVECDYTRNQPQAYYYEFAGNDCSGTLIKNQTLETFSCCQSCDTICDIYEISIEWHNSNDKNNNNNDNDLISTKCNSDDIDDLYNYKFYQYNGCVAQSNDGIAIFQEFNENSWIYRTYENVDNCELSPNNPINTFEFDQGCNYQDIYQTYINVQIGDRNNDNNDNTDNSDNSDNKEDIDICNYGIYNGLKLTANNCMHSHESNKYSNDLNSFQIECDYSGKSPKAYYVEYSEGDCTGQLLASEELEAFQCCESCESNNNCEDYISLYDNFMDNGAQSACTIAWLLIFIVLSLCCV